MPKMSAVTAATPANWRQRWMSSGHRCLKKLGWCRSHHWQQGAQHWYHDLRRWYQDSQWYSSSEERQRRVTEPKVAVVMMLVWLLATVMIALGIVIKSKHLYPAAAAASFGTTGGLFKLLEKDGVPLLVVGVLLHLMLLVLLLETMTQYSPPLSDRTRTSVEHSAQSSAKQPTKLTTEKSPELRKSHNKDLPDVNSVLSSTLELVFFSLEWTSGAVVLTIKRTVSLFSSDHRYQLQPKEQLHKHYQQLQQRPVLQMKRGLSLSMIWILASFATALGVCTVDATATPIRLYCSAQPQPALCLKPQTAILLLAFGLTAHAILACLFIHYAAHHSSSRRPEKGVPLISPVDSKEDHCSALEGMAQDDSLIQ